MDLQSLPQHPAQHNLRVPKLQAQDVRKVRIKVIGKSHKVLFAAWHTMQADATRRPCFSSRSFDRCLAAVLTSWVQIHSKRVQGIGQLGSDPTRVPGPIGPAPIAIANPRRLPLDSLITSPVCIFSYHLLLIARRYPHVGSIDFSTAFRRLCISWPYAQRAAISKWLVSPTKALFHHLMHKSKWVSTLDTRCTVRALFFGSLFASLCAWVLGSASCIYTWSASCTTILQHQLVRDTTSFLCYLMSSFSMSFLDYYTSSGSLSHHWPRAS
jgi:hypothetical protein